GGDFVVKFGDAVKNGHRGSEAVSFWVSVAAPIEGVNISMILRRQPMDLSPHALFHSATTASFPRRRESMFRNGDPRFRGDDMVRVENPASTPTPTRSQRGRGVDWDLLRQLRQLQKFLFCL